MTLIAGTETTCIFAFTGRRLDKWAVLESTANRHFDRAVGRWLDHAPVGYHGDARSHRCAGNRPE